MRVTMNNTVEQIQEVIVSWREDVVERREEVAEMMIV